MSVVVVIQQPASDRRLGHRRDVRDGDGHESMQARVRGDRGRVERVQPLKDLHSARPGRPVRPAIHVPALAPPD